MNSQVKRDHLVRPAHTLATHIAGCHADTQQMEGYFPWEESLCGVGSCLSCLICLRAFWLFLAHPANTQLTLTLNTLVHTGCFRFSYRLLLLGPFHGLEKVHLQREYVCALSNLILSSLTVADPSCVSNDRNLASDWPVWCERGGEKSHLFKQNFFGDNFPSLFCEVSIFSFFCEGRLYCWDFSIWNNTWLPNINLATT